ncbi:MAG: hypothetical protein ACRESZ_10560 [Methylococcales bacterium]
MPLTETELLERDAKRNIGEELLAAIRDVKSGHHGAGYSVEPNEIIATRVKMRFISNIICEGIAYLIPYFTAMGTRSPLSFRGC